MSLNNVDFHNILKASRKSKNWTQQEAADKIGISRSYYCDIENGRSTPSGNTLFAINEVMHIFFTLNDVNTVHKREVRKDA